jgi:Histidine phosphatase superfamily (branch 1)
MRLRYLAVCLLSALPLSLATATGWADDVLTLDFVRHGEAGDTSVINTLVPGPDLTQTGDTQADGVAQTLANDGIQEIYASTMVRSVETATPLADSLGLPVEQLAGLNEINAGIFEGAPVDVDGLPLGGALYLLAPLLWTLGLDFVPELGSSDFDGMAFENRVDGAVQTIYSTDVANDHSTDAVFSHEGTIAIWTLMNVKNPDFPLVLEEFLKTGELLPYTGTVEVQGDPADGWTLVDWDGQPVPQDPGLATDLFVDVRALITAPQMAAFDIGEAINTGDSTSISGAVQTGFSEVDTATLQFPQAVFGNIVDALHTAFSDFGSSDLASLVMTTF